MNGTKRRMAIARFIEEHDGADVQTLARHFDVSPMTIRRDRKILADQRKLAATHGGAVPADYLYEELPYSQKVEANIQAKKAIAQRAAAMVSDDSCIVLDAGTTTLELAKLLLPRRLSVITIDLQIALLLAQSQTIRVFIPGGEVDHAINGQLDMNAVRYLQSANPSLSFIGSPAWNAQKGATSSTVAKQMIKKTIIERSESSILLVDSSKYGLCNPWSIAPLNDFSCIITDSFIGKRDRDDIHKLGADLIIAT